MKNIKNQGIQDAAASITIIGRKRVLFVASVAMSGNPREAPRLEVKTIVRRLLQAIDNSLTHTRKEDK